MGVEMVVGVRVGTGWCLRHNHIPLKGYFLKIIPFLQPLLLSLRDGDALKLYGAQRKKIIKFLNDNSCSDSAGQSQPPSGN